jgi:hypothetical protein
MHRFACLHGETPEKRLDARPQVNLLDRSISQLI